jgi:hypothetical protein
MNHSDDITQELDKLSTEDVARVREYIAFLQWRAGRSQERGVMGAARPWQVNLLEQFRGATVRSSEHKPGIEVKVGEAVVGGERRPAMWAHPPISGEAQVEFAIPIPAGLRDLTLRFAIGIRDGAKPTDERLVAFRLRVAGWQVWSHAAWPTVWQPVEIALPMQAGDVLRLVLATDAMGDHQWAWAVWAEPMLMGLEL